METHRPSPEIRPEDALPADDAPDYREIAPDPGDVASEPLEDTDRTPSTRPDRTGETGPATP
jgi:hypothetical protein